MLALPFGFLAPSAPPAPVYPSNASSFDFFYSAHAGADWIDGSGNGRNGVETVTTNVSPAPGTTSAITYTGGATPYWEFTTSDSNEEQRYVATGFSMGDLTATDYTFFVVFSPTEANNSLLLSGWDGTNDRVGVGSSTTSYFRGYGTARGGGVTRDILGSTGFNVGQWYIVFYGGSASLSRTTIRINGTSNDGLDFNSSPANVGAGVSVGVRLALSTFRNRFRIGAAGAIKGFFADNTMINTLYDFYDPYYNFTPF